MPVQLNLGCGPQILEEFVNVDSSFVSPHVRYGDLKTLRGFSDESVDLIYCAHALQCLDRRSDIPIALKNWCRVLKDGGILIVEVPTILPLFDKYLRGDATMELLNQGIYGMDQPGMRQIICFDLDYLTRLLQEAGFKSVVPRSQPSWSIHTAATNLVVEALKERDASC